MLCLCCLPINLVLRIYRSPTTTSKFSWKSVAIMDKGQIVLFCPASVQDLHHQVVMDAHRLSWLLSMVLKAVCWR